MPHISKGSYALRYEAAVGNCIGKLNLKDCVYLERTHPRDNTASATCRADLSGIRKPFDLLNSVYPNMDSKSSPLSDRPPSYTESVSSPQHNKSPSYLPQNIAAARAAVISSLLVNYITPHLYDSALAGLASTTLILIPSNVSSLQESSKTGSKVSSDSDAGPPKDTIVGFASAENLTMIRLHGQENSIEFWRQLTVIQELGQQLRTHLLNSGHRVVGDNETSIQGSNPAMADWRTVPNLVLEKEDVRTRVWIMEICLRVENDMGLYETRTGKAVIVKVDVGS